MYPLHTAGKPAVAPCVFTTRHNHPVNVLRDRPTVYTGPVVLAPEYNSASLRGSSFDARVLTIDFRYSGADSSTDVRETHVKGHTLRFDQVLSEPRVPGTVMRRHQESSHRYQAAGGTAGVPLSGLPAVRSGDAVSISDEEMVGWRRATASPTQSAPPLKFSVANSHPIRDNAGRYTSDRRHARRPPVGPRADPEAPS